MLDFIKYFPLNLRFDRRPCTPKGPVFISAKPVRIKYEGNVIQFEAPRHSPREWADKQIKSSKRDYGGIGLRYFNSGVMANNHWNSNVCFMRRWAYWGPWFSGSKGVVSMSISVVGRDPRYAYEGVSFFHPKMFENVLVEYLNDLYGHTKRGNKWPPYRGPLNWCANNNIGIFSARFQVQKMQLDSLANEPISLLLFPISDDRFVEVCLSTSATIGTDEEGKRIVNTEAMLELVDSIIDSFSIELSPEVQATLNEIKKDCPDMSLSKTFAPLNWPVKQAEVEKVKDEFLLNG